MFRFIPLLTIPLIFTYAFDYYFDNQNNNISEKKITKTYNLNENIYNVHKNFSFTFESATINQIYSKKLIEKSKEENIVNQKPRPKKTISTNYKFIEFISLNKSKNSLYFISSEWKKNFSEKKIKFIETILPLIAFENYNILLERERLLNIKNFLLSNKTLSNKDLIYLMNISKKYKVTSINKHKIDLINEVMLRVNIIPNSIVLAQAVNESGWGTSRFAKEYNALFGQYTYDKDNGVVPFRREEGKKHLIKNFKSIDKSVESYFKNINSHYAYEKFRTLRSKIDQINNDINNDFNIKILTQALDVYAEDESYVDTINLIIDSNNLNQFNLNSEGFISL
jgi:Bax protein